MFWGWIIKDFHQHGCRNRLARQETKSRNQMSEDCGVLIFKLVVKSSKGIVDPFANDDILVCNWSCTNW